MNEKENEFDSEMEIGDDVDLNAAPAKVLGEKQISDYLHVSIDEDFDVTIVDSFMGETRTVRPKEEAVAVSRYILEFFDEIPKSDNELL